jgi:hypothetical protein
MGATTARRAVPAIAIANPLDHAAEIKEFFVAHGLPSFPDFFDRTYPAAVRDGAMTWLGRDESGHLVMHEACFLRRFQSPEGGQVVAGLMVNQLVATEYRTFFPALALVKRAVRDLEARGGIDFLHADPNRAGAVSLQAAGFARIGTLQRYVLPVGDRRVLLDGCIRLFHVWLRVTNWARGAVGRGGRGVVVHAAQDFPLDSVAAPRVTPRAVAAYHDAALYISRLAGYPSSLDWWLTVHASDRAAGSPAAAVLIRGPDASGRATLKTLRRASGVDPAAALPNLIAQLRRRGCTRLDLYTVAESAFGRAFRRAGFFSRPDTIPLLAKALTPAGEACLRAIGDWEITDLEYDR